LIRLPEPWRHYLLTTCNLSDCVEWLNRFYQFIQKGNCEREFNQMAIVLDQDGIFQTRSKLAYGNLPAVFTTKIFDQYDIEFRSSLIYRGITTIKLSTIKSLADDGERIAGIFPEILTS
jgi:hypothetical protein